MANVEVLYLSRADVEATRLTMEEIISAVEEGFRLKGEGQVEMPPKPGIHPRPEAFIHAMPAYVRGLEAAGCKWVSGYPRNQEKGLPYITGLLVLNDPDTGAPVAVMDCVWITAMRTGAATAVAAKRLARVDSATVGVIGCGVQGRTNISALKAAFPGLRTVRAFDTSRAVLEHYVAEMRRALDVDVEAAASPEDAVRGMDIVVTATPILKHPRQVIEKEWFDAGTFGATVDFDSYWKPEAQRAADKLYTDDTAQFDYYRTTGYFQGTPPVYADLGELATGRKPGRIRAEERIIAMNLGLALEDVVVGWEVYRRAVTLGIGQKLPL